MPKYKYTGASTVHLLLEDSSPELKQGDEVEVNDAWAAALEGRSDFELVQSSTKKLAENGDLSQQ